MITKKSSRKNEKYFPAFIYKMFFIKLHFREFLSSKNNAQYLFIKSNAACNGRSQ